MAIKEDIIASLVRTRELRLEKDFGFFGKIIPITMRVQGTSAATASNWTTAFFRAERVYELIKFYIRYEVAGTDGGTVEIMLQKNKSGVDTTAGDGVDMLDNAVSLKLAANTDHEGTPSTTTNNRVLNIGDSLSINTTGTLTSVQGASVTVELKAI